MIAAALLTFGILLTAWLLAPAETATVARAEPEGAVAEAA